jgi:hypothetical protein
MGAMSDTGVRHEPQVGLGRCKPMGGDVELAAVAEGHPASGAAILANVMEDCLIAS